jgi:hypothetical protein
MTELDRRSLLKFSAAAFAASFGVSDTLVARLIARGAPSAGAHAAAPAFFSATEFALVDELSELIIPTDAHSPGARAAKVAAFIDGQLAEAWDEKDRTDWREGLRLVDRLAQQNGGSTFMQSTPDRRVAVLTAMAQNEASPQKPEEQFFAELKSRVVFAYYTSEIGIKQEMEYKGNSYLNEFVGTDVSQPSR